MNPPPVSPDVAAALDHIRRAHDARYGRGPAPLPPYVQPAPSPDPHSLVPLPPHHAPSILFVRRATLPFYRTVLPPGQQSILTASPVEGMFLREIRLDLRTARAVDVDDLQIGGVTCLENGAIDGRAFVDFEDEDLAAFYRDHPKSRRPVPTCPITIDMVVHPACSAVLKLTNRTNAPVQCVAWGVGDTLPYPPP